MANPMRTDEFFEAVFILTFFSLVFWAFFEQSGSSVNNFTDRNVDRVRETRLITEDDVGKTVELCLVADPSDLDLIDLEFLSQEYLGHANDSESIKANIPPQFRDPEVPR